MRHMRQWPYFLLACVLITTGGFCAVIQQEDFGPGENGTLPATLDAEWDPGTDVIVTDLPTMGISSNHPGGDGYVLRLGDLGTAGWNFCYPANYQTVSYADSAVEAWVYFDFEGTFSGWRHFGIFIRGQPDPGGGVYPARDAYSLLVCVNVPFRPDYRAFILKHCGTNDWCPIGSYGTTDYTTGWHKLRIEAVGSEIKGYIDGNLEVSATDTDYASGFAGMIYYNASANGVNEAGAFDNFLWETYVAPTPCGVDVKSWALYE